jgi:hypothetical protein
VNVRARLTGTVALAAIGLIADSAMAKTISIKGNSKGSVQSKCDGVV